MQRNKALFMVVSSVCLIIALTILYIAAHIQDKEREEEIKQLVQQEQTEREAEETRTTIKCVKDENAKWMPSSNYSVIKSTEELISSAYFTSGYLNNASVTFDFFIDEKQKSESNVLFFVAKSEKASSIKLQMGSDIANYKLTTEPTAYYLPVGVAERFCFELTEEDFIDTTIYNPCIINISGDNSLYGQYNLSENCKNINLSRENIIYGLPSREVLTLHKDDSEYLCCLFNNELKIYNITGENIVEVGSLTGLGNTSHMTMVSLSTIAITARENGVYLVDIGNLEQPRIISEYDALDLATGIDSAGNFIFIASRYMGVEIVDISDINNPMLCSVIATGEECINCVINDNYLYISNWNAKRVDIYDITNINKPCKISEILTDGNPYGIQIKENNIFIATGHHSSSKSDDRTRLGFGAGHGMEIYDLKDTHNPKWRSTVKIDGRMYYPGVDSWGVYINDNYVYLSSTYNGVDVYDVSDCERPLKVAHIEHKREGSINYNSYNNENYIFPYKTENCIKECFSSIAFANGRIFMAGEEDGLFELTEFGLPVQFQSTEFQKFESKNDKSFLNENQELNLQNHSYQWIKNIGTVNGVSVINADLLAFACGAQGVTISDYSGKLVQKIETSGLAKDVLFYNGILYVAEGRFGIESYQMGSDNTFVKLGEYKTTESSECISQLSISADGTVLLAQDAFTKIKLFNVSSHSSIMEIFVQDTGTLYRKNLINVAEPGSLVGFESSREIELFSVNSGESRKVLSVPNELYGERNGMCLYEDKLICINNNVLNYYNLDTGIVSDSLGNKISIELKDIKIQGKISCHDNTAVICEPAQKSIVILDISDIDRPTVVEKFVVNGTVGIATITDSHIIIPVTYEGVLILER